MASRVDLVCGNLSKVINILRTATVKWFNLGLELGVDETTLKIIQVNNGGDVEACFREMISHWLKMIDPLPSWEVLVKALARPSVDCKELASNLTSKHGIELEEQEPGTLVEDPLQSNAEKPFYTVEGKNELYESCKPAALPNVKSKEYELLQKFCKRVAIILQVVTRDEYQAAITFMESPDTSSFPKSVVFPTNGMVVGMLAGKKAALIQTEVGENVDNYIDDAIKAFPNAQFVVGVGACFAFEKTEHRLGDVLVSEKISDLANLKFGTTGEIENRGQIVDVVHDLKRTFCITVEHESEVKASDDRSSKVYKGTLVSHPFLVSNEQMRDSIHTAVPTAIGGEMEGGKLLKFVNNGKVKGVIVIKGVANYGDGNNTEEWQFTAAMAAMQYVKAKLPLVPSIAFPTPKSVMSAAVVSSSSGSSSIDLPGVDLGPYFPYLPAGNRSKEELMRYHFKLNEETVKIKKSFTSFVFDLKRNIEETSKMEDVVTILKFYDTTNFEKLLSECKNLTEVFDKVSNLVSFFDYDLIKLLTRKLGSTVTKKKLYKYKKKFQDFSKRRVCECPSNAFGEVEQSEKVYVIKTDKSFDTLTVEEVHKLEYNMNRILGYEFLRLLHVKDGCVQLTFRTLQTERLRAIPAKHQQELRNLGVLRISYGDETVDVSKLLSQDVRKDDRDNMDDGDSGFQTGSAMTETVETVSKGSEDTESDATKPILENKERDLNDPRINMMISAEVARKGHKDTSIIFDVIPVPEVYPSSKNLSSLLLHAIYEGDLQRVKKLTEEGANPLNVDLNNDTLLHHAAMRGQIDILKYFIEEVGCNPATEGWLGCTTLHAAARKEQLDVVKYLVEQCQLDPASLDDFHRSPLVSACRGGDLDTVRYLVNYMREYMELEDIVYSEYDNTSMYFGNTFVYFDSSKYVKKLGLSTDDLQKEPLSCACLNGHLPIVKYLIEECNCDPLRPEGDTKKTALLSAVVGNHLDIVKYLATTDYVRSSTAYRAPEECLVYFAAWNSNQEMVKYLMEKMGCDPNCRYSGHTPIHVAIMKGNLCLIKLFLTKYKIDPAIRGQLGRQPIHTAAEFGRLDIIKYLIEERSCNPLALDGQGSIPLQVAACDGHLDIVRYLTLEQNCDPLYSSHSQVSCSIEDAVQWGHVNVVRFFLKEMKYDPDVKRHNSCSLIHYATQSGHLDMLKCLLEEFHCDPKSLDRDRWTILPRAVAAGHLHLVKYIIQHDYCDRNEIVSAGNSLVHLAAQDGHLNILEYLIEELEMEKDSINRVGFSALSLAAAKGHLRIVCYLLNKSSRPCDARNSRTPLHYAAECGHLRMVQYLMDTLPEMYLNPWITPLHSAADGEQLETIKYLIEDKHCDPLDVDEYGDTPLHLATMRGYLEVVRYLIHKMPGDQLPRNKSQDTPLHYAAVHGYMDVFKLLMAKYKCDPNIPGQKDCKPIHACAQGGHLDMVKYLIEELKCDPNVPESRGNRPIHCAASMGHVNVLKYLVEEHDCDPKATNEDDDNALHKAAADGHVRAVAYLVNELHCDLDVPGQSGCKPIHLATLRGHLNMVRYLVEELDCDPNTDTANTDTAVSANTSPLNLALLVGKLGIAHYLAQFVVEED